MKIEELKTRIYKSHYGWQAETVRTEKGQTFTITTMKRYDGSLTTTAKKTEVSTSETGFLCTSYSVLGYNNDFISVNHGKVQCTEKAVRVAHYKGLAEFDLKINEVPETEIKKQVPEVGDIIFMDGYEHYKGSEGNKHIIYEIENGNYGTIYKTVDFDTNKLKKIDHVRMYAEKFGIGYYFETGYNMQKFGVTPDMLSNMIIEGIEKAKTPEPVKEFHYKFEGENFKHNLSVKEIVQIFREWIKKEYPKLKFSITISNYNSIHVVLMEADFNPFTSKIKHKSINHYHIDNDTDLNEKGKEIFTKISKQIISYNFDDSDIQTDYFHTNFYINIAAGTWDKNFKVVTGDEVKEKIFVGATQRKINQAMNGAIWTEKELRDGSKKTLLCHKTDNDNDYLFTFSSLSQAEKRKIKLTDAGINCQIIGHQYYKIEFLGYTPDTLIKLEEEKNISVIMSENHMPTEPQKETTEIKDVKIIDYSEKAIAVIGNTKPIKDKLKELGGRFNFHLSCGVGWIFPKNKKDLLLNFI